MPLRMLGCALLLMIFAAFRPSLNSQAEQDQNEPATEPRWEYRVVRVDQMRCANERELGAVLNTNGQRGWEVVSYERLASAFPKDAEGTLLIKPAATGAGKLNNPQTVDSFQGTLQMKMGPAQQSDCRLLFKRILSARSKQ